MLIVPSFNGDFIFGQNFEMRTAYTGGAHQYNTFLGVPGVMRQFLGLRMYETVAIGRHYAADPTALGLKFSYILTYQNSFQYVLYDTKGRTWEGVVLDRLDEGTKIFHDPGDPMAPGGSYFQDYRMTFVHLIPMPS